MSHYCELGSNCTLDGKCGLCADPVWKARSEFGTSSSNYRQVTGRSSEENRRMTIVWGNNSLIVESGSIILLKVNGKTITG